jgi:hypothetical protein
MAALIIDTYYRVRALWLAESLPTIDYPMGSAMGYALYFYVSFGRKGLKALSSDSQLYRTRRHDKSKEPKTPVVVCRGSSQAQHCLENCHSDTGWIFSMSTLSRYV